VRAGSAKGSANAPDPLKELASLPAANSHDIPVLAEPELLDDVGGDEELSAESADPPATETSAPATGTTANPAQPPSQPLWQNSQCRLCQWLPHRHAPL
jgi:hypothetical protein